MMGRKLMCVHKRDRGLVGYQERSDMQLFNPRNECKPCIYYEINIVIQFLLSLDIHEA